MPEIQIRYAAHVAAIDKAAEWVELAVPGLTETQACQVAEQSINRFLADVVDDLVTAIGTDAGVATREFVPLQNMLTRAAHMAIADAKVAEQTQKAG